ncbi:conserved oligomeric Golgi complex subunit 3-like [Dorcoceras hygrometricum]|uniref:Conserved oligomeric Golgi complex subunit 3-like n=1 Tax=Dorcoceras hygrometricum TaxID=472368 RepID=A0A2Z7D4F3_9LAMI|nr:conserved oligomeric Golgi complex subunit 3-like [Dorcoceras hygrometricum]
MEEATGWESRKKTNTATTSHSLNTLTQGSKVVPIEISRGDKLSTTNLTPSGDVNRRQSKDLCSDEHEAETVFSSDSSDEIWYMKSGILLRNLQMECGSYVAPVDARGSDVVEDPVASYSAISRCYLKIAKRCRLHKLIRQRFAIALKIQQEDFALFISADEATVSSRNAKTSSRKKIQTQLMNQSQATATSSITDSACKNQLVVVSVQYGPFNPYIPIRSTTIGKLRVVIDPIAMHTSWRSNSDIASVTSESSTTMHRLLHASGSHPIPTPYDPKPKNLKFQNRPKPGTISHTGPKTSRAARDRPEPNPRRNQPSRHRRSFAGAAAGRRPPPRKIARRKGARAAATRAALHAPSSHDETSKRRNHARVARTAARSRASSLTGHRHAHREAMRAKDRPACGQRAQHHALSSANGPAVVRERWGAAAHGGGRRCLRLLPCWQLVPGSDRFRQSGPRPETGFLRQPALEGLTRSTWTDSPRQIWPETIFRRAAAAVSSARRRRREDEERGRRLEC